MKKRISILLFVIIIATAFLPACNKNTGTDTNKAGTPSQSDVENTDTNKTGTTSEGKNVIFRNAFFPRYAFTDNVRFKNALYPNLEDIANLSNSEEDTLYAFVAIIFAYGPYKHPEGWDEMTTEEQNRKIIERETRVTEDMLRENGFTVLKDYPLTYLRALEDNREIPFGYGTYGTGHCAFVGTIEDVIRVFNGTAQIDGNAYEISLAPRPDIISCVEESGVLEEGEDAIAWLFRSSGKARREIIGEEYTVTLSVDIE